MAEKDLLVKTVQDLSTHVFDLVKKTGDLSSAIAVLETSVSAMKNEQERLVGKNETIISSLRDKMDPDRCLHLHDDLRRGIKKEIFGDIKKGASGWMSSMLTVLKIAAYASVVFGGSAVGANALGIF